MNKLSVLALPAVLALATAALPAYGQTYSTDLLLQSSQVVPAAGSNAFGAASVEITVDTDTNTLNWDVVFARLSSDVTGLNFFAGAPGTNGALALDAFALSQGDFTAPLGSLSGSATISDEAEQNITAGNWYLQLSTVQFPGGELRGQLPASGDTPPVGVIPEPASLGLLALAAGALGLKLRRR